ncbi:diguanylate cyclase domain-containing protein [Caldisalinibacter kiritimatiensis]|uniref:Sensory box protein n=1 Tax=Caldisalinibacter kiritimatiensis TaxID=1304284 RepID=R1CSV5_9FIRM|nr:diguanylate cyclase [Caldisalinibacter kiritimatiensis]EOD01736.1 sensory box protein [Caldisalinibacter kiritimatiensis]
MFQKSNYFYFDYLTGLPNRQYLYDKFSDKIKDFVIVFLDIDNFKYINDTFGFKFGDKFLMMFSNRLSKVTEHHGKLFIYNGDKFILLLPNSDTNTINKTIKLILKELQGVFEVEDHEVVVSVSSGVYIPENNEKIDDVVRKTVIAMYEAKRNGKGQFQYYNEELDKQIKRKSIIASELAKAVKNQEFYIFYQPIFNIKEKNMVEVEALMRWRNDKLGEVSPAEFIPIAEETGLINKLGYWIIQNVCKQIKTWNKLGLNFKVAINISPKQLHEKSFVKKLKKLIAKENINFSQLRVKFK